jgi:hypothetical protein
MATVLRPTLADPAADVQVSPRYLRYKPGTNLVVHYRVWVGNDSHDATAMIVAGDYLERRAARPENVLLSRMVHGRTPASRPLYYDRALRCLVQWFPLDIALPALAESPTGLRRRLRAAGLMLPVSRRELAPLAYKPRRRAVGVVGRHVVKFYASEGHFLAAASALEASAQLRGLIVPALTAVLPSSRLTVQALLSGHPPATPIDVAPAAGALLRAFHSSRLGPPGKPPTFSPADQLAAAAASARLVGALLPALRGRVGRLTAALEDSTPSTGRAVPSHGDFNARQLLIQRTSLAVTDLDELCLAPPGLDLGTFAAYLVQGTAGDVTNAVAGMDALLDGYGERPDMLSWYLATMILRRAPRPFRHVEPDWPERVEYTLTAAEEARRL